MTMPRLLSFLIMLAFALTNGAALAAAMCQHRDAGAHIAASYSLDAEVSAAALGEETAASAASKKGSVGDTGSGSPAGYMVPPESPLVPARMAEPGSRPATQAAGLADRSLRPLLEPPLA